MIAISIYVNHKEPLFKGWHFLARELHCTTPNGTKGFCTQSKNCPKIQNLLESTASEFVTKSICGIDLDNSRLFCCDQNDFHVELAAKSPPSPSRFLPAPQVAQRKTLVRIENLVQRDESASVVGKFYLKLDGSLKLLKFCESMWNYTYYS